jgi:membrane-anchored protein YejM (alkaline phosphatase superfamily)
VEILTLIIFVIFIIYSLIDLHKETRISKRQKTNLAFMITLIPIGGSLIYVFFKENFTKKIL